MRKPRPVDSADMLLAALRDAHKALAEDLLRLREQALGRGLTTTWTMQFVEQRMALVEQAIAQVSGEVLGPPGEFGLAAKVVEQAYAVGLNVSTKSLLLQGEVGLPIPDMAALHQPAMQVIAQEITDGYQGLYHGVLRHETDAYRRIQGHFTQVALATGETGSELTGRLAKEFVDEGLAKGGVMTGLKRKWAIEDYAEMLGRTVAQKAAREASLNRASETGNDLVILIGGRIEKTCDTCLWADGRVFSISGVTAKPEGVPEEIWRGPIDLAKVERSGTRDRKVSAFRKKTLKNTPPVGHPRCIHTWGTYVADSEELVAEDLRNALEEYATDLGLDIANGGQVGAGTPSFSPARDTKGLTVKAIEQSVPEAMRERFRRSIENQRRTSRPRAWLERLADRLRFEDSDEFKRAFLGSQAVDENGNPVLLFSGSVGEQGSRYMATNPTVASHFTMLGGGKRGKPKVTVGYANMQSPIRFELEGQELGTARPKALERAELDLPTDDEHDGIIARNVHESGFRTDVYIVKSKEQVVTYSEEADIDIEFYKWASSF